MHRNHNRLRRAGCRPAAGTRSWIAVLCGLAGAAADAADAADTMTGRATDFNLLVITLDTVRADRLGTYGYERGSTRTLDRFAAPGIVFEQAIAPTPTTLPSHATIFTGLEPPDHGVRNNGSYVVADDVVTMAEVLRDAGYETAAFVASYVLDSRYGLAQGFHTYDDAIEATAGKTRAGHLNQRRADVVTRSAVDWFDAYRDRASGQPFFMWVHYFDAHQPYELGPGFFEEYENEPYDGEIAFIDANVDGLMTHLYLADVLPTTLVVLTADHGEGLGDHGEATHSRLVYDTTQRVPLVLHAPALFPEAVRVSDRVVGLVDVMPTVLDLLGIAGAPPSPTARHLLARGDRSRAIYVETLVPLENHGWAPLFGLRRLHDKYIRAPEPEYYVVEEDPGELTNRYREYPDALDVLVTELDRRLSAWPPVEPSADRAASVTPEQRRRLAALGYVGAGSRPASSSDARPDPKDMIGAWERASRAMERSAAGHHDEALAEIEAALEENPRDAQAWHYASTIHQRLQRPDRAAEAIRKAIALQPTAERWVRLGQLLTLAGAYDDALAAIDEAEALDPREGGIYISRGQIYCVRGDLEAGRRQFERALEIDPVMSGPVARSMLEQVDRLENR